MLQRANFLLLDEPTNHLDIASQEVLESVIDGFPGTILLVTHDRYLVDRLATQLWIIDAQEHTLHVFQGTWAEYADMKSQETQADQVRQAKDKWSDEQRQARREEQRARREQEARQRRAAELDPWLRQHPPELDSGEWWYGAEISSDEPIVQSGLQVLADLGLDPQLTGYGSLTDAIHLINYSSIPTISIGPDRQPAHMADEYVDIDELLNTTKALALAIMRWCGVAD